MLLRQSTLAALTLAIIVFASSRRGYGAEYYASPSGSGDGTLGSPFSLFQAASTASAGDTVYLRGGTYAGTLRPLNSGSSGAWITFAAYPGELPIFDGSGSGGTGVGSSTAQYIRFIGIVARNYSSTGFGNGWTDSDCTVTSNGNLEFINVIAEGNGINGVAFYCASGIALERSIVVHNGNKQPSWSSGVNLFGVKGTSSNNVVRQTISFENIDISPQLTDGNGFILDQRSTGATFENNVGFRNGGSCIRLTNSPNAIMVNNTCFDNGIDPNVLYHDEIFFSDPSSRSGAVIRNTVAVASSGYQAVWGETGVTLQNNVFIDDAGPASFFVSTAALLDFHLTSDASTLIDQGSSSAPATDVGFDPRCLRTLSGQAVSWWQYAVDYDYIASVGGVAGCFDPGVRSGTPDIGAYELTVGSSTTTSSTTTASATTASATTASATTASATTASATTASATTASATTASATTASATTASATTASATTASATTASATTASATTASATTASATTASATTSSDGDASTEASSTGGTSGIGATVATGDATSATGTSTTGAASGSGGDATAAATGVGGALSGSDAVSGTGEATSAAVSGTLGDTASGTSVTGSDPALTTTALTTTSGASCAATESFCGSTCADLATDPGNCGVCGFTCAVGETCSGGLCAEVSTCQAPLVECGASCVDTASSPVHCGNCGSICAIPQVCSAGLCTATCARGLMLCGQACVEPSSDLLNCGACGSSCQVGQTCQGGACVGEPTGGNPNVPQRPLSKVQGEPGCDCSVARGDASTLGLGLAGFGAIVVFGRRRRRGRLG